MSMDRGQAVGFGARPGEAGATARRLIAAATLLVLGATTVLLVGFAHTPRLHAAAHDARHAFAFPCH
jgi:cobalt transporter subunit CbtB